MSRGVGPGHWLALVSGTSLLVAVLYSRKASASRAPAILAEAFAPAGPVIDQPQPEAEDRAAATVRPVEFGAALDARDIEAAARMIASENPKGSRRLHIEQVWTELRSKEPGQSLFDRMTAGNGWGGQGERIEGSKNKTRPVATGNQATQAQRELAEQILLGREASLLPGAKAFFEPAQEDKAFAVGERARAKIARGEPLTAQEERLKKYKHNAAQTRQRWAKHGSYLATIEGVEFWT